MALSKDEIIKQEIIEQARQLFAHYGFDKTAMNDIAKACGKAKSTVYHYFESKDEIYDAVLDLEATEMFNKYKLTVDVTASSREQLRHYITIIITEVENKINFSTLIKRDFTDKLGSPSIIKQLDNQKSIISKILNEGVKNGEFMSISDEHIEWMTEVMIASMFGVIMYFVLGKNANNTMRKLDVISEIILNGFIKK